jgi:hypothetical protein
VASSLSITLDDNYSQKKGDRFNASGCLVNVGVVGMLSEPSFASQSRMGLYVCGVSRQQHEP